MRSIKEISKSIAEIGIRQNQTKNFQRKIKLSNILSIILLLNNSLYIPLFIFLGLREVLLNLILGSLIYALSPILNHFEKFKVSRILLIVNAAALVTYFNILFGKQANIYLFYIVFSSLPFLLFEDRETYSFYFVLIIALISFVFSELMFHFQIFPTLLTSNQSYYLSFFTFVATFFMIFAIIFNFYQITQKAEEDLLSIKEKQDGDYFLTSMIIEPLFRNFNTAGFIETEMLTKQKKDFIYKGKTYELGGDISIIGTLNFYGINYTMVINADAMGKSMQGAGGAIVLGTVINSILSRYNGVSIKMQPRTWLKTTLRELQNVFVEFDGSMFISCILGLISWNSAKFTFFNSEHPSAIILRDNKANFIPDTPIKKIGFPDQFFREPIIDEFQLLPGDILILGSDGRDDINLTSDQETRNINSDENLFLHIIESVRGELHLVPDEIKKYGESIDDLSLVKIKISDSFLIKEESKIDKTQILDLIRTFHYQDALDLLESRETQEINEFTLFYKALCMEKLGMGNAALSILEIHDLLKDYIPGIFLRSNIYFRRGKFEKALSEIQKIPQSSPEYPKAELILKKIQKKLKSLKI